MKPIYLLIGFFALIVLTSCADQINVYDCTKLWNQAGFWNGLWHGMTLPVSFWGSLFSDNIAIYAVNNNGNWYDWGFVIGAAGSLGGGAASASRR